MTKTQKSKGAFIMYRFPFEKDTKVIWGSATKVDDFTGVKSGFVIQDFTGENRYVVKGEKPLPDLFRLKTKQLASTTQRSYVKYVKDIQKAIGQGAFTKAVAARVTTVKRKAYFDYIEFFHEAKTYPEAFVCLVYIPDTLCWVCASPELLLKTTDDSVETHSLAGTLKGKKNFSAKEKEEQNIVTQSILETLSGFKELEKPEAQAKVVSNGSLNHLLSVIRAKKNKRIGWNKIAKALHPTPAVGGYPKKAALDFIKANEGLDRSFYSGFLGVIENNNAQLYVNLRCVEVTESQLIFYAGCGITAASDPKKEWEESNQKIDILKSLLASLIANSL